MSFIKKMVSSGVEKSKEKFKAQPIVKGVTTGYTTVKGGYKATKKAFVGDGKCLGGCGKSIPTSAHSCSKRACVDAAWQILNG